MFGLLSRLLEVALTLFKRKIETPTLDEKREALDKSTEISLSKVMELRQAGRHVEAENMLAQLRARGLKR